MAEDTPMDNGGRRNGGSRPVPDPTVLTTQNLEREVANLKEASADFKDQLDRRHRSDREFLDVQIEVIRERLNGIDTATDLRLRGILDIPTQIDEKVGNAVAVMGEKFASIANQFDERDTRSERESRDNKLAVDAAFAAQEKLAIAQQVSNAEAVDKSEKSILESIAKLSVLVDTQIAAMGDKIDDIKDRVGRVESVKIGVAEAKTGLSGNIGLLIAALAVAAAIVIAFVK